MILGYLSLEIKRELYSEFDDWFRSLLTDTRKFDGCHEVYLCHLDNNKESVKVISKWESLENYQSYLSWRSEIGTTEKLSRYISKQPEFSFLQVDINI
jgi:quinol monooxygenase YgiN